jgi:Tfp pilus assembly protein PilX
MLNYSCTLNIAASRTRQGAQSGLVLILALIVLTAMSLAAVGLMRSVMSGNRVAGNLAFQQAALQSSDVGIETAVAWLEQKATETSPGKAAGDPPIPANKLFKSISAGETYKYVALRDDPDPGQTLDDWWASLVASGSVNTLPADASGNVASFAIHRLCAAEGDPNLIGRCEAAPKVPLAVQNSSKSSSVKLKAPSQLYYRITVRVQGIRNASSFVQAIVAI